MSGDGSQSTCTVAETVADAMLRHPTVHPADLTAGEAREIFEARPKTHLLLLATDDVLVSTLTREDLATGDDSVPAVSLGTLDGRTTSPDVPVDDLRTAMTTSGLRRIAVVDADRGLLGLLCLKASLTGFCTDDGVREMRASRRAL